MYYFFNNTFTYKYIPTQTPKQFYYILHEYAMRKKVNVFLCTKSWRHGMWS